MELVKTIVAFCLSPLIISLLLQFVGWIQLRRKRTSSGHLFLAAGTIVLLVGAIGGLSQRARQELEHTYPPLNVTELPPAESTVVVVLGTGFNPDSQLPANSKVSPSFLSRLIEATRVVRELPEAQLVVSVAGSADEEAKSGFLDEISPILQLDRSKITLLASAESTGDEARFVREEYEGSRIVLATSAAHMSRAVRTFESEGLNVIPAPAAFYSPRPGTQTDSSWQVWLPSADGLSGNHGYLYEAVATAWQGIKG